MTAKAADTGLTTIIQRSIASLWLTQAFGRERDEFNKFQGAVDDTMRVMFRVHWREVVYERGSILSKPGRGLLLERDRYRALSS